MHRSGICSENQRQGAEKVLGQASIGTFWRFSPGATEQTSKVCSCRSHGVNSVMPLQVLPVMNEEAATLLPQMRDKS